MLPRDILAISKALSKAKAVNNANITGVCINSLNIKVGDLFIALSKGKRDGHDFIEDAENRGASACMVTKLVGSGPKILVPDTEKGLWEMGLASRKEFNGNVLAITGSYGKTSTRDFLGSILKTRSERKKWDSGVLTPYENFNNHLGVPLTLTRLRSFHHDLVLELGANALGEIDRLAGLANPSVGAILNARDAHLQGFGSAENIVLGKGEILKKIQRNGTAVLPVKDHGRNHWDSLLNNLELVTFGYEHGDVAWGEGSEGLTEISTPEGSFKIRLPIIGGHFRENAACATAMALSVGVSIEDCMVGLEATVIQKGRMSLSFLSDGRLLVDDSYNASPGSVRVAIDWLSEQEGNRLLILGGLSELGSTAPHIMETLGEYASKKGIDRMITTGNGHFFGNGFRKRDIKHVPMTDLLSKPYEWISDATVILVKASRSEKLDRLIYKLKMLEGET